MTTMTRYHFGKRLGPNFSHKETRFYFNCSGSEDSIRHISTPVQAIMVVENTNPVGYICPHCGLCWSTKRGDRMVLPVINDPLDVPEVDHINIGPAGQRYLERKRTGKWPGGQPS